MSITTNDDRLAVRSERAAETCPRQGNHRAVGVADLLPRLIAVTHHLTFFVVFCHYDATSRGPQQYWRASINGCSTRESRGPSSAIAAQANNPADDNQRGATSVSNLMDNVYYPSKQY